MAYYHELYDSAYEKMTPEWFSDSARVKAYLEQNNQTLREFFEDYREQFSFPREGMSGLRVLDLGCGLGGMSQYFARLGAQVVGIDVSSLAVSFARNLAQKKGLDIDFRNLDLSEPQKSLGSFDLVFDSHLLHCLTAASHRANYFDFVRASLAADGRYLLETMVFQKHFRAPVGYTVDDTFTLWKESGGHERPIRKLLPGIELETEVKSAQLEIRYLYFHAELSFEVFDDYEGYPRQNLPQTARLAAMLKRI